MSKSENMALNEATKEIELSVSARTAQLVNIRQKANDLGDLIATYLYSEYGDKMAEDLYDNIYCPPVNSLTDAIDKLIFESIIDNLTDRVITTI